MKGDCAEESFSDEDLKEIYYAGILHDVGKIGIKEDVLTKRTRLTPRHMDVVKARFQLLGQFSDFDWSSAYETVSSVNKAMTPEEDDLKFVKELGDKVFHEAERVCHIYTMMNWNISF